MDIQKILAQTSNPQPYDKGTAVMWTDTHISKQLLDLHINPDIDTASRNESSIEKITAWILKQTPGRRVLDLGCGPGLYAEKLAQADMAVTGMDFSENSIAYARQSAAQKGLAIDYVCADYLTMEYEETFDLVMMIYCDFGVLSIDERQKLLANVHRALKNGGVFIFDALNRNVLDSLRFERSWDMADEGFWRDTPYICLSEGFHFPAHKATLDQHVVIEQDGGHEVYRFWNHYFDEADIDAAAKTAGFLHTQGYLNLLEKDALYNGEDVTFYKLTR